MSSKSGGFLTDHTLRPFKFTWQNNGCKKVEFVAELEIPLNIEFNDCVGMLCEQNCIPIYAKNDLIKELKNFVDTESEAFYNSSGATILENLRNGNTNVNDLAKFWVDSFVEEHKTFAAPDVISNNDIFREAYQSLLITDYDIVRKLLTKEKRFTEDVQRLIRERDLEVEHMKKEHANLIDKAVHDIGKKYSEHDVNKLASNHFEKINMVESNYASQLTALMEEQRREFHEFVLSLNEETLIKKDQTKLLETPEEDHAQKRQHSDSLMDSRRFDESFTIHLGAQLKTMHNLKLTALNPIELCRLKSNRKLEDSQRLQMALNLYSNQLHGLVLMVDCRPMFHLNLRTDFLKACEQATELHFSDLENQLHDIEKDLIRANNWRQTFSATLPNPDSLFDFESKSSETLRYGDVYVTRHSNLSQVHVVFHLVADDSLKTHEINSRHPCINGLRNIIRLCYKFGVAHISIPLLLVDRLNEELTISWCLKRAELIFKCVKGFMMECATLSNTNEQYTVQFFVPTEVSSDLFNQLSEMLPTIFHLANPLVAKKIKSKT